ncbi:hypothetical protein STXM2123_73 [Streptomyces sp. F-3]|nr:hypothetical protein STXM2123_73 [Streptomyces sp. F-3]
MPRGNAGGPSGVFPSGAWPATAGGRARSSTAVRGSSVAAGGCQRRGVMFRAVRTTALAGTVCRSAPRPAPEPIRTGER